MQDDVDGATQHISCEERQRLVGVDIDTHITKDGKDDGLRDDRGGCCEVEHGALVASAVVHVIVVEHTGRKAAHQHVVDVLRVVDVCERGLSAGKDGGHVDGAVADRCEARSNLKTSAPHDTHLRGGIGAVGKMNTPRGERSTCMHG